MSNFIRRAIAVGCVLSCASGVLLAAGVRSLAGSEWGYRGKDLPYVQFGVAGKVSGHAGCNRFFGRYEIKGDQLRFGPLASTRKACQGAVMKREKAFLNVLERARGLSATHLRLKLKNSTGKTIAKLVRRAWD